MAQLSLRAEAAPACGIDVRPSAPVSVKNGAEDDKATNTYVRPEILPDGGFRRQGNEFPYRFGYGHDDVPVIANRYTIIGLIGCGWNRRQRIVLRLLGLDSVVRIESVIGRDDSGWILDPEGLGKQFGYDHIRDFYEHTKPGFSGRPTSPAVIDNQTGKVVTNEYHTLSLDWETVWKPFHKPGAPDLYPRELRPEIDLLNQQLFEDVNNGTYKIIFATEREAAEAALGVFEARLAELDYRLKTRRYLFGTQLTDSDVRLFQTLEAYEVTYRPKVVETVGHEVKHLWDFEHLWAYARDLFATPGFIDDEELRALGFVPFDDGDYAYAFGYVKTNDPSAEPGPANRKEYLARWQEPANRESLGGIPEFSGPGTGGTAALWSFAR
ncbi:glutathione S-transferase C-terminal domain-containing protein [Bifidobacterium oedipodis]|uniref:Glutathione S-transferase n=1 Tax=Bifidobacterium oedipodis TaxID=2675322 RepID=A0A7Y0EPH9_9BIFI|nr:glutathione S-transferase C-terminal domain-containing protein [Bifidobacterium sp. DSM 109957]NMM92876.1 glutathione S-transferase [Bifidobacterium sp. DSM 109957]